MGWRVMVTAVAAVSLSMVTSVNARGQSHGHPQTEPAPTGTVSPELETFGRAVAVQARLDQLEYFREVLASTDQALQVTQEIQRLGKDANNVARVNQLSLELRDALDDIDHYNRRLLVSFTKSQDAGLKTLTKELHKSYTYVERDQRTVQQLMEPGQVVAARLATGAANLEKSLSDFRTDEIRLGRDMGISAR